MLRPSSVIVLDGAMGTELLRRDIDTRLPLWSARALSVAPDVVREVHEDYLRAGADVLTANTFRTNPRAFAQAGLGEADAREATRVAVELAHQAFARAAPDREPLIAGSLAPVEDCYHPERVPGDEALQREHDLLAGWLAEDGVSIALVETMNTAREARLAVRAAAERGLRVWASFVTGPSPERLLSGEPLSEAAVAVLEAGAEYVGINCVRPESVSAGLERLSTALAAAGPGLIGYANAGRVAGGDWDFDPDLRAPDYTSSALRWIATGARVVGGCCGTGPGLIAAVRRGVDKLADAAYDRDD